MKKQILSSIAIASVLMNTAIAAPVDSVYTPYVEYGKREFDYRYASTRKGGDSRRTPSSIGFGYSAGDYWFTKFHLQYNRVGDGSNKYDGLAWENKFQLTDVGQYPVDIGFIATLARPQNRSEGYELTLGPLFQSYIGSTQLNGNLLFVRNFRADVPKPTQLEYQWQARYRMNPKLDFGAQGFGEFGRWDHWAPRSQQTHLFGPALFGKLPLAGRQALKYNAAYLIDANDAIHSKTFRVQIEYEF